MTQTGAVVDLDGVHKSYTAGGAKVVAVDDVTLEFAAGSMTAITGASGSGKSTLLHISEIGRAHV